MINKIEDLFVSNEIAIALKRMGFNEPCIAYYSYDHKFSDSKGQVFNLLCQKHIDTINTCTNDEFGIGTAAPIIQQAADWILSKYGYFISTTYDTRLEQFDCIVCDDYGASFTGYHETNRIAMLKGFEKATELIFDKEHSDMNLTDFIITKTYTVTSNNITFKCKGLLDKIITVPCTSIEQYEIRQVKLLLINPEYSQDACQYLTKLFSNCQRSYHQEEFDYMRDFILENNEEKVRLEECAVSSFEDNILILDVYGKTTILK